MGILVYVLGRSGTGKSFSMRNFPKEKLGVVNVQGKILPFKGAGSVETINTDQSDKIVTAIKDLATHKKSIVVDDFQYVMANEFMRRAAERGYDKFTEIARHAWDIADCVRTLPGDVIVYVLCHTDTDTEGTERLKTIGKLLDEKICLEGMSTIVLKTNVSDGQYTFLTQNNGKDTVKSPAGMFPSYAIDNDLYYVDEKIRNYYELGEFLTDDEIAEIDEAAKKDTPIGEEKPKRRTRRGAKSETPETSETPEEPVEDLKGETAEEILENAGIDTTASGVIEGGELPRRRRRNAEVETPETAETPETPEGVDTVETADATPTRRRRRRTSAE